MSVPFPSALIRYERLKRNWSQEGLCEGICAVSYLSKIEQGKAEPSDDILQALMRRLDLEWHGGEEAQEVRGLLEELLEAELSMDGETHAALMERIAGMRDVCLNGPYMLDLLLLERLHLYKVDEAVGVGMILLLQGGLSIAAAITESFVKVEETDRRHGEKFSLKMWWNDIRAAVDYLRGEEGLKAIYAYMAVTNGVGNGYGPLLVAFFRTAPGFSVVMYSAFSVAEFAGRTLGGLFHYNVEIPRKKRFAFAFGTYQFYELMDMILLWVSYPLMLVNRFVCGFLGVNSASLREAAVQRYIPDEHRAKLNAFLDMIVSLAVSLFALLMGALCEVMDYRWCITLSAFVTAATCWLTIWRKRKNVRNIYQREWEQEEA